METIKSGINNKGLNYNAGVGNKLFGSVEKIAAGSGELLDGLQLPVNIEPIDYEVMDLNDTQSTPKKIDENAVVRALKTYFFAHVKFSEGVLDVGESLRDFLKMNGTVAMGNLFKILNVVNDDVYNEMIEETKKDVSENDVYDYLYKDIYDTGFYDNVYAKDFNDFLFKEGGKFFEIIGLSLAGSYIANAGMIGAEATYAADTGVALSSREIANSYLFNFFSSSRGAFITRIILSGVNGAGEELQTAYENGATSNEGLRASYIKGLWDSLTWAIGEGAYRLSPFRKLALGQREIVHMDYRVKNFITQRLVNLGLDMSETGAQTLIDSAYTGESLRAVYHNVGGTTSVGVKAIYSVIEMALLG